MNATIRAEIYSILPCPNGCSLSAGILANLKPIMVITEEPASDKLLKASAVIAILAEINPTENFIKNKIILTIIPTILAKYP